MDRQESSPDERRVAELADAGYEIEPSSWRVKDLPEGMRPREEIERRGVEHVADSVLIAVLLRTGVRGVNVVDLAHGLMRRYGSLTALAGASVEELSAVKGIGSVKAQILKSALEIGRRLTCEAVPTGTPIRTPGDAARVLRDHMRSLDQEQFWVLHLNAKNCLKSQPVAVTSGLLDASLVHPREVFRDAVRSATAAVVLVHNHPSGDPTPSAEDIRITRQLVESGKIMDIKVLDHVIIGKPGPRADREFLSMRELGVVDFA
jgi:DNA repair protein RadC